MSSIKAPLHKTLNRLKKDHGPPMVLSRLSSRFVKLNITLTVDGSSQLSPFNNNLMTLTPLGLY